MGELTTALDCLDDAAGVLLAVSGGPDSMALMHLAVARRERTAMPPIAVASVNHGLRPGSRREADDVVDAARALGFTAQRLDWLGDKPQRGLPARAREARYRLLAEQASALGASHVVTAHTLDDQAETVLLRLARGSGVRGLAGMRRFAGMGELTLVRPLLQVPKADLVALCRQHGWPFVEDPTNGDETYARPRWRAARTMLAREGLTPERLAALAGRMARADAALAACTDAALTRARVERDSLGRLRMASLASEPDEIVIRVLEQCLVDTSGVMQPRLERLERVVHDLLDAAGRTLPLRRSLHHCVITLDRRGLLSVSREVTRRRGRPGALQHVDGFLSQADTGRSASLGKGSPASYIGMVDATARRFDVVETHGASTATAGEPMHAAGPQ